MPKVSLHDHLDGGLRIETILDLARQHRLTLPEDTADGLSAWVASKSNAGSLVQYLEVDDITSAVLQTSEALERVARERVEDLAAENVLYAELRWAPEETIHGGLSLHEAVEAVASGINKAVSTVQQQGKEIQVNQLLCGLRHSTRSREIAELAVACRDLGIVGFDIAGPEAGYPLKAHASAFDYLSEQFFPVTVHAGEADGLASIGDALIHGRALRLGHGVRLLEDIERRATNRGGAEYILGPIARWVRDRGITLEICPTSNVQTGAFAQWGKTLTSHPFDVLYQLGFRVTVSPDNSLNSATSVSREILQLHETFGYTLRDLINFQLNAVEGAFVEPSEKTQMKQAICSYFDKLLLASEDVSSPPSAGC